MEKVIQSQGAKLALEGDLVGAMLVVVPGPASLPPALTSDAVQKTPGDRRQGPAQTQQNRDSATNLRG